VDSINTSYPLGYGDSLPPAQTLRMCFLGYDDPGFFSSLSLVSREGLHVSIVTSRRAPFLIACRLDLANAGEAGDVRTLRSESPCNRIKMDTSGHQSDDIWHWHWVADSNALDALHLEGSPRIHAEINVRALLPPLAPFHLRPCLPAPVPQTPILPSLQHTRMHILSIHPLLRAALCRSSSTTVLSTLSTPSASTPAAPWPWGR
jgi:hypothetical protein